MDISAKGRDLHIAQSFSVGVIRQFLEFNKVENRPSAMKNKRTSRGP